MYMMGRSIVVVCPAVMLMMVSLCSANALTGYYYNNWRSGKCLCVDDTGSGAPRVVSSECDRRAVPDSQQLWNFEGYPSIFVHMPSGNCLDVAGHSYNAEGAELILSPCRSDDLDQYWTSHSRFHRSSAGMTRIMQIKNDLSGLCLDVEGVVDMGNGVPTKLAPCEEFTEMTDQWWTYART